MKSTSSIPISPVSKFREALRLAKMHFARQQEIDHSVYDRVYEEYDFVTRTYVGKALRDCRVYEIGYGARPFRMYWLANCGVDVRGIDLDHPLISVSVLSLLNIVSSNGVERLFKSAIRRLLFDSKEWAAIDAALRDRGVSTPLPLSRAQLRVGSAADRANWAGVGPFDFIYSEDVFEHVPREELPKLIDNMADCLSEMGVALIRPMIFTGLCGGHLPEWYRHLARKEIPRSTEPWEHLRRKRAKANTYLNELTRREYVALFSARFEVLVDSVEDPDLGRQYLHSAARNELASFDDYELFSNSVKFVLRRKQTT